MRCAFCSAKLDSETVGRDKVFPCPRCGVATVATDAEGEARWREALESLTSEAYGDGVQVVVQTFREGGQDVRLVQAWSPEETMSVIQAANALGLSRPRVSQMLSEQERGEHMWFPGARRVPTTRPKRYKRGRWRIPRRAVQDRLARKGE